MLPLIAVGGTPGARGQAHGRAASADIHHNIALYYERFAAEGGLERAEVQARARPLWAEVAQRFPDHVAEAEGVAQGSGADPLDIAVLNLRFELVYSALSARMMAAQCTSFAVTEAASGTGTLLMGQNWDWIPGVRGAVMRQDGPGGAVLAFTEAGIVGAKIGLNEHGVGLAVNGLLSTADSWRGGAIPFHVRTQLALEASSAAVAMGALEQQPHACSANFMVGDAEAGAWSVETCPTGVRRLEPVRGRLVHTNHFIDPTALGAEEPPNPRRKHSIHRLERLRTLLDADPAPTPASIRGHLTDHVGRPNSVCRHQEPDRPEGQRVHTVCSVVLDLGARTMWIAGGPPCRTEYQRFSL